MTRFSHSKWKQPWKNPKCIIPESWGFEEERPCHKECQLPGESTFSWRSSAGYQ